MCDGLDAGAGRRAADHRAARCAAAIASPNGVPPTTADSLSWLPPVMKTPVGLVERADQAGSWASLAALGPDGATTSPAPSSRNSAS